MMVPPADYFAPLIEFADSVHYYLSGWRLGIGLAVTAVLVAAFVVLGARAVGGAAPPW